MLYFILLKNQSLLFLDEEPINGFGVKHLDGEEYGDDGIISVTYERCSRVGIFVMVQ